MQEEKILIVNRISAESSQRSNLSSCMSIQRMSSGIKDSSHKDSLHLVMSVEGSNKSDLFQQLINSGHKKPTNRQSYEQSITNATKNQQIMGLMKQRQSINNMGSNICVHICTCYDTCDGQVCPCYDAKDQFCQKGNCCVKCIQTKLLIMQSKRDICTCKDKCLQEKCSCFLSGGLCSNLCQCSSCHNKTESYQRNIAFDQLREKIAKNSIFCTCKKTKCNKKYCGCYANGIKCGPNCVCQDCMNCDQYSPNSSRDRGLDVQIKNNTYIEQETNLEQIPQNIQFVPFNYRV